MKRLLLAFLFSFLPPLIVNAGVQATFYVAPNGSGTAFSQAQPGDLLSARNQIRTLTPTQTGDIVVYLYGGVYSLTNGFQLQENATNHDSGTGGYNVIYEAYPGAVPVISGGITVSNWTLYNATSNIWRAYVGPGINSRQLYVNGVRAIRARGDLNPSGFNRTAAGFSTADTTMQSWGNVTNIEIVDRNDWKQLRCPIASITGTNIVMQTPGWNLIGISPQPGHPWNGGGSNALDTVTWIENAYELLAAPGMWYLNRATGYLYYIPRPGENLATANVVLPVAEKLVDAGGGSLATPIHNIIFAGISFEYATWLLPSTSAGYADNQTSIMWASLNSPLKTMGNISFQTALGIQLTNDVFEHLGGSAVDFGGGAHGNVVIGGHFEDISACGITLGEVTDYATGNPNQMTDGNVIQDNYIRGVGEEYEDAIGIWVGYAKNTRVIHNDIANVPYSGMSVGWGWGTDSYAISNLVDYNYVGEVMETLNDGGCFYTLSAQSNSWAIGNYLKNSGAHGIYWDEGTAYYTGLSNVVDNCAGYWVNMWIYTIHNCLAMNNFSNVHSLNNSGTDCVVTNTTYVAGQNWSAAAQSIIQNAGLEPAYTPIQLPETTINDDATNCVYNGSWSHIQSPSSGDYNGDIHSSTTSGDYVDFTFFGTGVSAVCRGDGTGGNVDVYLDGAFQTTVSATRSGTQPQQVIFSTNNLSVQTHTLRLVNNGGQSLMVDGFKIRGVPEIIINDNTPVYDHVPDDWTYSSGRSMGDYQGDLHYTQGNGEYVQYTFVGSYIVWIGEAESSEGNVDVYLDGVFQTTVNCYSSTRLTQQRLFTATNLSPGRHAIKLIKKSGDFMVVDAFAVVPTPPPPAAPGGLNAVGGTNTASLSWVASSGATGYNVKRSMVSGGPYVVVNSVGATNDEDQALAAGTTYFYVVSATNSSGESANSAEARVLTVPVVTPGIPAAPTGLTLSLTNLQAEMSWSASAGATSYNVKRATISGGPYITVTNVVGTVDADAGLNNGTTYYYVLSAVNGFGESADSAEFAITTVAAGGSVYQNTILADHPVGYWPLDLTADTNTDGSGNLLASDLSGNGNTGTYRFITRTADLASGPSIFIPHSVSFDGVTTYVDLSTGSNKTVLNLSGKITMEAWVVPASSGTYGDLMGKGYDSALNEDELEMRANGGSYHGGAYNGSINDQGVTGGSETTNWTYVVCTYDGSAWNLYLNGAKTISTTTATGALSFGDPWAIGSGTADGLSRVFTGNICEAALYNTALTAAQISTHYSRGRNGQAPAAPVGLMAAGHDGQISLSWSPSLGATAYHVERSTVTGGPYTQIGSAAGTGYVDTGLANGTTYYYVVSASNSTGTSGSSTETNATPAAAIPITLSPEPQTGAFVFSFTAQSNQSFVVETSTNLIDWMAVLTNVSADGQFSFSGIAPTDSARFYRVRQ